MVSQGGTETTDLQVQTAATLHLVLLDSPFLKSTVSHALQPR